MIFLAPAALLWAVAVWRAPSTLRTPRKRALWLAFIALAVAMTIKPTDVASALDSAAGVHNLATLLKHLCAVTAAWSVLSFVDDMAEEKGPGLRAVRQHSAVPLSAGVCLAALFFAAPQPYEADDILTAFATDWRIMLYGVIWTCFLATALLSATRICWQWGRHPNAGLLGRGLRLTGVGTMIGIAYAVHRVLALVLRFLETNMLSPGIDRAISNTLLFGALLFIIAGSTLPASRRLGGWSRAHRDLVALRPLWYDLTSAVPVVRYEAPRGRVSEALDIRHSRDRLYRRGIEIRDAVLSLASHASEPLREEAHAYVARHGLVGAQADITAEACWIRVVRHSREDDERAASSGPLVPPASGGLDLSAEIQAMKQLSTAYRSDLVIDFAERNRQDPA